MTLREAQRNPDLIKASRKAAHRQGLGHAGAGREQAPEAAIGKWPA